MSIFGSGNPKLVGTGDPNTNIKEIRHVVMQEDWDAENIFIEKVSPLSNKKTFIGLGSYSNFTITSNIFKLTNVAQEANALLAYAGKQVKFIPYGDDETATVKKEDNTDVIFYIENVRLRKFNNNSLSNFWVVDITLRATDFNDTSKNLLQSPT